MNEEMINNVENVAEAGNNVGKKIAIVGAVLLAASGVVILGRKIAKKVKAKKETKKIEEAKEIEVVEEEKEEE